mgnify:FL=1
MIAKMDNLKSAIDKMNSGVYDFTDNGKCTQCGACCSNYLPMTQKEIATIHRFVKKHDIKEFKHLFPVSNDTFDMTCPFMDDSKQKEKCRIHSVRPEICKQFICSKEKKPFNGHWQQYSVVDMRKEFYGK